MGSKKTYPGIQLTMNYDQLKARVIQLEVEVELAHTGIKVMEQKIESLKETFGTTLVWMSGSSVSPLRHDEVRKLLEMMK